MNYFIGAGAALPMEQGLVRFAAKQRPGAARVSEVGYDF